MDLSDLLMGSLQWDIIDLANRLRQERLFVTSEQQHLQELNEKVVAVSSRLAELAWVTAQQRDNLNILIVARPDCKPAACCYKANTLENTRFVDGLKLLGFQECLSYGEFLQSLRTSPSLLASCLVAGDRLMPNMMHGIIHSLSAGLFGSSLLPEDNVLVLRLLQHLTRLQIVPSDNPRRLLRKRCCAFARLYGEFHESLFSAKLFLTAALHHPIMQLLVDHDVFLDIDPDKATIRFSPEDRVKRFGKENSPEYPELILEYRQWTIGRLVVVTSRFLSSLRENMHCFPTGVCWLVRQIASLLSKSSNIQPKEVSAICTDLVFTHFICPAIVDPEPYGITDAPISEIARFNLMQVAKIIQTLAMTKYEEIDPKVLDLYSQFDKDCVSCLLDAILDSDGEDLVGPLTLGDNSSNKLQGLSRSSALFTETELNNLVTFVQAIASDSTESQVDKKELATVLQQLPSTLSSSGLKHPTTSTPPETPKKMVGLLGKVGKSRSRAPVNGGNEERTEIDDGHAEDVLVIPFSPEVRERVGFLPEHKVLCMKDLECEVSVNLSGPPQEGGVEGGGGSGSGGSEEKRSRAHSHDDGSIGNTSDNLEAVSEAASNHSVASSLELETEDQNDNLSDMVSANVSGRGTPNISGRDTPSSQITEGDEGLGGARGGVGDQRPLDFRPPSTSKQSRSDIDDKFGKFEIKKLLEGDETVSMVSDTWSTDVLASDSETVEQSESQRLVPDVEVRRPDVSQQLLLDVSETASEAWSTDVLASDTERLTEVDTDDTGSVARSDDTARSEVDDPLAQSTPLGTSSGFRPIREPSLHVPASPTRVEVLGAWNVTGRGGMKADYRRRVVEYVDSNRRDRENQPNFAKPAPMRSIDEARMIHVIDKIDKTADTRPPTGEPSFTTNQPNFAKPIPISIADAIHVIDKIDKTADTPTVSRALPLTPLNISTSTSAATQTNGDLIAMPVAPREAPPLVNGTQSLANHITPKLLPSTRQLAPATVDSKSDVLDGMEAVRLSSASLNSTSSSSSGSDPRPNTVTPTPESPATVLVNGHHPQAKPTTSTGAIPKSISFDKTAERGDKELLDDDQKQKRGSFFRNFKLPFKNRRGKSLRGADDLNVRCLDPVLGPGDGRCRLPDTTDDILAKYRRKPADAPAADGQRKGKPTVDVEEDERLTIDPTRVEQSYAFGDAKRKLRMVLSTADLQQQQRPAPQSAGRENELVLFLQLQLAEAINLQDRPLIAHLHETLRCIRLFDSEGCRKLFHSLKEDYQKRAPYINYLVRCRQGLLSTLAHLDRLMERVKSDQDVCSRFLVAVCVRMFLERHDSVVQRFIVEFQQLTLADEKMDLLDNFLHQLASDMEHDPTWQVANESQLQQAHMAVERAMMSRVYMNALYPNGDGDMSRDHVLHEHMDKLSKVVTPNHKDLRIPNRFQYECPWASAQAEVSAIAAYKTPRDKLQCVLRCTLTIMNLLAMAAGIPAADDFTPVLVFVLIKANPPALLSTIQYIDSFYANRLEGEDQYWWTQFCSAVEFIKTMDYTD